MILLRTPFIFTLLNSQKQLLIGKLYMVKKRVKIEDQEPLFQNNGHFWVSILD